MTIANVTPETEITASGGQTIFAWGSWVAFADADIDVYQNGTLLTLTTHYTVDRSAKEVTLVTGATLNDVIVIRRTRALARSTDFNEIGKLRTAALNDELDYIYAYLQEVEAERPKAVRSPAYELVEMILPAIASRAGKYLSFDANGLPLMADGASLGDSAVTAAGDALVTQDTYADMLTLLGFSAFIQTLIDDADAATVRATLGLVLGTDIYSKSALDTLLAAKLALAGGTMTGNIDMNGNQITMGGAVINMETAKITNVTDPTSAQDAATKAYVDAATDTTRGYWLAIADYMSKTFDATAQTTTITDLAFSSDGTKMYVASSGDNKVYQYTLSTAWDVSTASYASKSADTSGETGDIDGLAFSSDGTKMYVVEDDAAASAVFQYTLSTAWDVSTASYASKTFNVHSQLVDPWGICFGSSGTKMYVIGEDGTTNEEVHQYTLSTAWDVSTASYDSVLFDVGTQETEPKGIVFNDDGTKFFVVGETADSVFEYRVPTAWVLTGAVYTGKSLLVSPEMTAASGLTFGDSGSKLYVCENNAVFQYIAGARV